MKKVSQSELCAGMHDLKEAMLQFP